MQYNASGNLWKISSPDAPSRTFYYEESKLIAERLNETESALTNPRRGALRSWTYGAGGVLTEATIGASRYLYEPTTAVESFLLYSNSLPRSRVTDPRGAITTIEIGFGANGSNLFPFTEEEMQGILYAQRERLERQLAAQTIPIGAGARLDYRPTIQRRIDPDGGITTYVRQSSGVVADVTDPQGLITHTETADGSLSLERRSDGYWRSYDYTTKTWNGETFQRLERITDERDSVTRYTYDSQTRLATMTNALGQVTTYEYWTDGNGTGLLKSVQPPLGPPTTYYYDRYRRFSRVVYGDGTFESYVYDVWGNPWKQIDRLGNVTETDYDRAGKLWQQIDVASEVTRYIYDASARLDTVIDPLGRETQYLYNDRNQTSAVIEMSGTPGVRSSRVEYDAAGNPAIAWDAADVQTIAAFDRMGRAVRVTAAAGRPEAQVSETVYKPGGWLWLTIDPLGRMTRYDVTYTPVVPLGAVQQTTVTEAVHTPLERSTVTAVNTRTGVQTVTNAAGYVSGSATDVLGRVVRSWAPPVAGSLPAVSLTEYDALSRVRDTEDMYGSFTWYSYNDQYRRIDVTAATGTAVEQVSTSFSDALGRTIETIDPRGLWLLTLYNDAERRVQQVTAGATGLCSTSSQADAVGRTIATSNERGVVTETVYNDVTRRTDVIEAEKTPAERTTSTYLDVVGNTRAIVDPDLNSTVYAYDGLRRQISDISYYGVRTFTYDRNGNVVGSVDRNGRARAYTYDVLGRQTAEQWLVGATVVRQMTFSYTVLDQVETASDPDGDYLFGYNTRGQLSSVTKTGMGDVPTQVLTWSYDQGLPEAGYADTVSATLDGSTDYQTVTAHDALGRVTDIARSGPSGQVEALHVAYAYDLSANRVVTRRYLGLDNDDWTVESTAQYDDRTGELTSLTHDYGAGSTEFTFGYDNSGRLVDFSSSDGSVCYRYDDTDQLVGAVYSLAEGAAEQPDEGYAYDANGNRTSSGYSTDAGNRLRSDGTYRYSYDAEGNRTERLTIATGEKTTYEWDARNRLVKATDTDAEGNVTEVEYTYDVYDRRVSRIETEKDAEGVVESVTEERYGYEGSQIAFVWRRVNGGALELVNRYLYGPSVDEVLAEEVLTAEVGTAGRVLWQLADHLGTVRDVVNALGSAVNHVQYDAFGKIVAATDLGSLPRFTYTGREYDAVLESYYYRARYYDPGTGKFLSNDPIGFRGGDPNLSRYVGNDPTMRTDPSGEVWFIPLIVWGLKAYATYRVAGAVVGGVYSAARAIGDGGSLGAVLFAGTVGAGLGALAPWAAFGQAGGGLAGLALGGHRGMEIGEFVGGLFGGMAQGFGLQATHAGVWKSLRTAVKVGASELAGMMAGAGLFKALGWNPGIGGLLGGLGGAALGAKLFVRCFPAGTLVSTEGGLRPIEEVLPGQRVWGYDFAAGCWRLAEVAIQHSRDHVGQMVEMRVGETVLSVTPGHPFWVESGEGLAERPWPGHLKEREDEGMALAGRWVNAADVREGDTLVLRSGERGLVSGHRLYAAELRVYNLTVLEVHTYAVGGRGVLVHNGSGLTDRQRSTIDRSSELTITTGAAANRLDRALGGAPRDKFFAHHIIPWDLRTHPVVKAAAKAGFNINGKLNGILLGYAPHKYGHKAYDTALASLADELLKLKLTDTQYAHVLQKLADQIGRRLSRNSVTSMDQVLPPW